MWLSGYETNGPKQTTQGEKTWHLFGKTGAQRKGNYTLPGPCVWAYGRVSSEGLPIAINIWQRLGPDNMIMIPLIRPISDELMFAQKTTIYLLAGPRDERPFSLSSFRIMQNVQRVTEPAFGFQTGLGLMETVELIRGIAVGSRFSRGMKKIGGLQYLKWMEQVS